MKFKVIKQDWYTQFERWCKIEDEPELTPQEVHDWELEEYKKDKWNYDGPFRYIEPCDDMPFPPREGLKYCIRLKMKPSCTHYRAYQCYCYQLGQWWKYKEIDYMFTEIHIPQFMSHYEYTKLKCPYRFLNKRAQIDSTFHLREHELREIGRETSFYVHKCLKSD